MRYISQFDNLILMDYNGAVKHKFEKGVLIVGSAYTGGTGSIIDAATQNPVALTLQNVFPTDLNGGVTNLIEMKGQGSLDKTDSAGSALSPNVHSVGYRGNFFKAALLTANKATVTGERYQVLSGAVGSNSVTYNAGDIFDGVSGTSTNSDGTYAQYLPKDLVNICEAFRDEEFKIKHLKVGDEVTGYFNWATGYTAKDSMDSTSSDFIGWTR